MNSGTGESVLQNMQESIFSCGKVDYMKGIQVLEVLKKWTLSFWSFIKA